MNQRLDALRLARVTRGDPRVVVAVLDGPVDFGHEALVTAKLTDLSIESCKQKSKSESTAYHGTMVCSIIFGQGPAGINGIAPDCRGIVIPIFRDGKIPGSIVPCSQVELAIAIERAIVAGANIINISGGQYSASGTAHPLLNRVIERAADDGVLIVSATGNDSCPCYHIPSAHPAVLAVGAHDRNGNALESSNWGEKYQQNGVVALGDQLLGAVPGGTRRGSGTSFATPIVSGVAALLMSRQLMLGQKPNGALIHKAIIQSAHRCFEKSESCQRKLAGILNPVGAYNFLFEETLPMNDNFQNQNDGLIPASDVPLTNSLSNDSRIPNTTENPESSGSPAQLARHVLPSSVVNADAVPFQNGKSTEAIPTTSSQSTGSLPSEITRSGIEPSACACSCTDNPPLVFVIGDIGYDFGTEARRDSIRAHMMAAGFGENPEHEQKLVDYLEGTPWDASAIIWTITLNNVPIYAVRPDGPYAAEAYARLVEYVKDKIGPDNRNHVAIPGRIVGKVTLLRNAQTVPIIQPEIRGMGNWGTTELVEAAVPAEKEELSDEERVQRQGLHKILDKIYYEHQNLGIRPQDRAINYAASNTTMLREIIKDADRYNMFFDNIELVPSEICRPGSECWIVKVNFYVPQKANRSRRMYRFSIDVSDVVPVSLSDMRDWYVR